MTKRNAKYLLYYLRFCHPSGPEYAEMLKHLKIFYSMGENCSVIPGTYVGDAKYIRLGNNVRLAGCLIFTHDGVVNMLGAAYNLKLDAVGKVDIGDNVFIGYGASVMRGVTIGNNCVVAAGSTVVKNIPPNSVVGGVPAKRICSTDELVVRLKAETESLPWNDLIQQREGGSDPEMELILDKKRLEHWFGEK